MTDVEYIAKCLFCCYLFQPKDGIGFCTVWKKEKNGQDEACKHFEEHEVVTWARVRGFI